MTDEKLVMNANATNIEYADGSAWEEWQKEYQYGAFYIIPPKGIIEPIDELRCKYDPKSHAISPAHISLSEPLRQPLTEAQVGELKAALAQMEPFEIHYGPLRSFPPSPGVVYSIEPNDTFMNLRLLIHSVSIFRDVELKHKDIPPHMTIAEFGLGEDMEQTNRLLEELGGIVPTGIFLCDSIELAVPNKDFYFERAFIVPLGKNLR